MELGTFCSIHKEPFLAQVVKNIFAELWCTEINKLRITAITPYMSINHFSQK